MLAYHFSTKYEIPTYRRIHFVTCKRKAQVEDGNTVAVAGDYSRKIEEIVLTALKLRKDDPDVKIIIFSHWETILNAIAKALAENDVKYRNKSAKLQKSVDEFKVSSYRCNRLLQITYIIYL